MNTNPETIDPETQLRQQLHRRAAGLGDPHLSLDGVVGRARKVRRRQLTTRAAGALAVVMIAIPIGLSTDDGPGPDSARDSQVADAPAPVAAPVTLTGDAPMGAAPELPWLQGSDVHVDGARIAAERTYNSVSTVGDRVLAHRSDPETGAGVVDEIGPSGSVEGSYPARGVPISDTSGLNVVWPTEDGTVMWATPTGQEAFDTGGAVLPTSVDSDGVWFIRESDQSIGRLDPRGELLDPLPDAIRVNGSHEGLVAATTSVDQTEAGSCGAVLVESAERWSTCDYTLTGFAPDGQWLLATDPYLDGIGQSMVAILDARTGERQVRFETVDGFVSQARWEDPEHVLAVTYSWDDQQWRILRLGLDGSVEQAVEPVTGEDVDPVLRLGS